MKTEANSVERRNRRLLKIHMRINQGIQNTSERYYSMNDLYRQILSTDAKSNSPKFERKTVKNKVLVWPTVKAKETQRFNSILNKFQKQLVSRLKDQISDNNRSSIQK
jgi:hypothetical protein